MKQGFHYTEENQEAISFPLGGIGSGCIGLAGNGHLRDWEIFNRPAKGQYNGYSHFAVKVEDESQVLDARILNGDLKPHYIGQLGTKNFFEGFGWGPLRETMAGMPHFPSNTFCGKFPIAQLHFADEQFPGKVSMEAFNPLIPHEEDDSSIPAAFFSFTLTNTEDRPLTYHLTSVLGNPYPGMTRNCFSQSGNISLIALDSLDFTADDFVWDDVAVGNLCLATDAQDISYQEYLYRGEWFDALEVYWKDTTNFGPFANRSYEPADCRLRDNALLSARIHVEPGESQTVKFVISWYHPRNRNTWGNAKTKEETQWLTKSWKNYYASLWSDATAAGIYALKNWCRLYQGTVEFRDALFSSTLPEPVLDAVAANISLLKSPSVWRLEDGTLYSWEGVGEKEGSCEGSCTHVWGYAQALPFLFPALSRSMREAEYNYNWASDGSMTFRLMLPVGSARWHFRPAADGQFATIMKTYREWRISGDIGWLQRLWSRVKAALEFAWSPQNVDLWDPDKTGTLTGRQHHTLDMELYGPNSWLTGMYLGALRAGEEMAQAMGDTKAAAEYRRVFERGRQFLSNQLFNGEYFIQKIDLGARSILAPYVENDPFRPLQGEGSVLDVYWSDELQELKYQIGEGVSIDQILGQWHADIYGLGEIFEPDKTRMALSALIKYNFRETMRNFYNPCRLYCLNDESGLVICSWPEEKKKPTIPAPYSQETMHGFEYAAADLMIRHGLKEEGLVVVKAIRDRYDGKRRNPWNEIECGSNYVRSMASYALLLSFSGFAFDGRRDHLSFRPVDRGDFRFFWSFRSAWGVIQVQKNQAVLEVKGGQLTLRSLGLPESVQPRSIKFNDTPAVFSIKDGCIETEKAWLLQAGDSLLISS